MEETKKEYVNLEKLKQANARCETILETLPTTVFLISLGLMSYLYKPLRLFTENDILLSQFPIPYIWFITILCSKMMVKSGLEKSISKLHVPLQSCC